MKQLKSGQLFEHSEQLLSMEEEQQLLKAVWSREGGGISDAESAAVRAWAREVRIKQALLELTPMGRATIVVTDGQLAFERIGGRRPRVDELQDYR